jgi:hypothetical protein
VEKVDMEAVLKEEFKDDPVYRLAVLNGLEDSLFTKGILSLHKDLSYSTVETGRIIERSDSTIRNHFRSDLIEYIAPERFGKYYRLNYTSVFRLHIVFMLMERAAKTTVDILAELGMQPGISMGGNIKRMGRVDKADSTDLPAGKGQLEEDIFIEERFEKLEQALGLHGIMLNILKYEKDIADVERKMESTQSQIEKVNSEARMKYLEEKNTQLVASSLRAGFKKRSFFGGFKKNEDFDINKLTVELEQNLKEKYKKEVQSKVSSLEEDIKKLNAEKEMLEKTLLTEKESFSNFQQLENANSNKQIGTS